MAIAPELLPSPFEDEDDFYPTSDGKPMAETDLHIDQLMYCKQALLVHFAERSDVYVAGNNFIYYEQGNRSAVVSPDSYVVFGVAQHQRNSYKVWREGGHTPSVVIEITSKKTRREDEGVKREKYRRLGVSEYYQLDPTGDYVRSRLKGSRLVEGEYQPMPLMGDRIHSPLLELDLVMIGETMRFFDPRTGERIPDFAEQVARTEQAERQREAERDRAQTEALRAETEALARAEAEQQAASERHRAEEAEAKIAQLLAELEALKK